jgi:hypothetical protein
MPEFTNDPVTVRVTRPIDTPLFQTSADELRFASTGAVFSGTQSGVRGTSFGDGGGDDQGVFGFGRTGVRGEGATGVEGVCTSPNGTGVRGVGGNDGQPGQSPGVVGQAGAGSNNGVRGFGTGGFAGGFFVADPNGGGIGVFGQGGGAGSGPDAVGVFGQGGAQSPGVVGHAGSLPPKDVRVFGQGSGVAGFGDPDAHGTGVGVFGLGRGPGGPGVRGIGSGGPNTFPGNSAGVYGQAGPGNANGVEGHGSGTSFGVAGFADPQGGGGAGVFGSANGGANNVAGRFTGDIIVKGTVAAERVEAPDKQFVIDHPLDPANKYLAHASVESCEQATVYSGNIVLDNRGEAVVHLPAWVEALCEDFRYQLTCVGRPAPVYVADEVADNHFRIAGGLAGMKVSWQLTGIRKDAWAKAHPLVVEQDKPAGRNGERQHINAPTTAPSR